VELDTITKEGMETADVSEQAVSRKISGPKWKTQPKTAENWIMDTFTIFTIHEIRLE
jgi:hypothetical protein